MNTLWHPLHNVLYKKPGTLKIYGSLLSAAGKETMLPAVSPFDTFPFYSANSVQKDRVEERRPLFTAILDEKSFSGYFGYN